VAGSGAGGRLLGRRGAALDGAVVTAARFTALVAYRLTDTLRAQRALLPAAVFVVLLAVLLTHDRSPAPGPWPVTVLALYVTGAWLALATANTEEPGHRAVTTVAAGGAGRVVAATVVVVLVVALPLAVLAAVLPAVLVPGGFPTAAVVAALVAHAVAAFSGTAVGLVAARPLVHRVGWAASGVAVVLVLTATQPRLPPVGDAVRLVGETGVSAPGLAAALGADLGVAVGLLGLAGLAVREVSRRRPE
jgi:hypothetical protein